MSRIAQLIVAGCLSVRVMAQTSTVTPVFLPFADQQALVASVIAQSGDVKTLVIQCPEGTVSDDCGFPAPITVTAGPSTFHHSPTGLYQAIGEIDCKLTGTTEASCAVTAGLYSTRTDDQDITTPAASSSTDSAVISGTDIIFVNITITAGAVTRTSETSGTARSASVTGSSSSRSGLTSASQTSASANASASGNGAGRLHNLALGIIALPLFLL